VVAKIRETLAVNKQSSHKFHMDRFHPKKLCKVVHKEKYHAEVSNSFAALKDLKNELETNSAWETVRENINISAKQRPHF
jgi:hypothetical protein